MQTKKTVHIVKINNGSDHYHIVEEEGSSSGEFSFECDTQKEAIDWALSCHLKYEIHRERNRKPGDKHGQFRKK
ncbi:hypothetical protein QMA77_23675 [Pantoea ananatis]|uniref:hypothetical protein n=1 Tax=Pantoea ananas TaxID=553 RepID=UPI0024ADF801|nr:hypothetical protein [Pantoea ananatis]MDI6539918.1 hypothetical protein [Pantoea ananatis]